MNSEIESIGSKIRMLCKASRNESSRCIAARFFDALDATLEYTADITARAVSTSSVGVAMAAQQ